MSATAVEILNTIRDNMSEFYQKRIPEATKENLKQIGDWLASNDKLMNEYINGYINEVGARYILAKIYNNKFAKMKQADVPYGSTINEIYINPAVDVGYSKDQTILLKTTRPDGKVAYYGRVRTSKYPVTITEQQIMQSFRNEMEYMSWHNATMSSLYSGDNIDEELTIKGLFGSVIEKKGLQVVETPLGGTTLETKALNAKELAKQISIHSKWFSSASTNYAGYNLVNEDVLDGTETPAITWVDLADQCLVITAEAETELNFEYLASLYHIEIAQLKAMTVQVDMLPCKTHKVHAVLMDKAVLQVRDALYKIKDFENGATLEYNYWLHHHEFVYLSMFGNMIAFGEKLEVTP